jgi:hypothetical protein
MACICGHELGFSHVDLQVVSRERADEFEE